MHCDSFLMLSGSGLPELLTAQDWDELLGRTRSILAGTGIDDFLLRLNITDPEGCVRSHLFSTLPDDVSRLFDRRLQGQEDSVNHHLACSGLPLAWTVGQMCEHGVNPAYQALGRIGIQHGASFAVRGALTVSRLDFYRRDATPLSRPPTADLLLLGSYLHEAVHALWKKENPDPAPTLTRRERECLYWSAGGKTSKETAMILGISQHTVYFHLKNVASKFNVYSTRHAITRASRLGMLTPQLP
ncbi:helix-turn-helix transcriptional regulator [Massilia horti]|uniref:LuxR family transcriptional regulator n=1 Tax=Massilia horti TaxID=2562153 RepID=A0A4Y9SQR3_9BURK|nr:LuxR family transcriptional regulator [Massilia horti]TFW28921.1 LuxR family transcriptional regulator [Massilia horti]